MLLVQLQRIGYALNSPGSRIRSEICLTRATPLFSAFVLSPLLIHWQWYVRYDGSYKVSISGTREKAGIKKSQAVEIWPSIKEKIPAIPQICQHYKYVLYCGGLYCDGQGLWMFCHHSDIWPGAANGKQIWELQGPKQEIGNYKYRYIQIEIQSQIDN